MGSFAVVDCMDDLWNDADERIYVEMVIAGKLEVADVRGLY